MRAKSEARTRILYDQGIRDGTCIACNGTDQIVIVNGLPVCANHRKAVTAPHPLATWKDRVRQRHSRRTPMRQCENCGTLKGLTRHHNWTAASPGNPPRPVILCKPCHAMADGFKARRECEKCGRAFPGKRSLRKHELLCRAVSAPASHTPTPEPPQ